MQIWPTCVCRSGGACNSSCADQNAASILTDESRRSSCFCVVLSKSKTCTFGGTLLAKSYKGCAKEKINSAGEKNGIFTKILGSLETVRTTHRRFHRPGGPDYLLLYFVRTFWFGCPAIWRPTRITSAWPWKMVGTQNTRSKSR